MITATLLRVPASIIYNWNNFKHLFPHLKKKKGGKKHLFTPQAFHHTLEGVNLGSNPIGNKGVECLKEGLLSSRSIARLVMASCHITNEGIYHFCRSNITILILLQSSPPIPPLPIPPPPKYHRPFLSPE